MQKPVLGIKMEFIPHYFGNWEKSNGVTIELGVTRALVGTRSDSAIFVTNKEIRKAIARSKMNPGDPMGDMELWIVQPNLLEWYRYFPLPQHKNVRWAFKGKGIAQLLELHTLLYLHKKLPKLEMVRHSLMFEMSEARKAQLEKRGLGKIYSLKEMIAFLQWKVGKDTLQKRSVGNPKNVNHRQRALEKLLERDPRRSAEKEAGKFMSMWHRAIKAFRRKNMR